MSEITYSSISSLEFYNIFENLTNAEFDDVINTIEQLFQQYIQDNSQNMKDYKFNDKCCHAISTELYNTWYDANLCNQSSYDSIYSVVESNVYRLYINNNIPHYTSFYYDNEVSNKNISETLEILSNKYQPTQKSKEWYSLRNNIFSASSIWKLFRSNIVKNNYIKEKAFPINKKFNLHSPSLEWGNKYEPVSIMIYQDKYNTSIGEYGCILHDNYKFIGASPDGINIDQNSQLFGRMLEIKNVFNRFITGIPKEDYWIQMQLQMETCNLDVCDFLETRFLEYSENEFYNDSIHTYKGIILQFSKITNDNDNMFTNEINTPLFVYYPINKCLEYEDIHNWIHIQKEKYSDSHILYTTLYWYLHELSCVIVRRNRLWFNSVLPIIQDSWNNILQLRENNKKINITLNHDNNYVISNMTNNSPIKVIKT